MTGDVTSMRPAARSGARLGLLAGVAQQLLSVGATLTLVRILSPRDIGLAALAALIVAFAGLLTAAGLGEILVKRRDVDERVIATLFWVAFVVGLGASGALAVLAVPLSWLSGQPHAAPLIVILAPTLAVGLVGSVPRGLLQRRLEYRRMYASDIAAMLVYVAVQITLAIVGAGAASIVVGQLSSALVGLVLSSVLARWRPRLMFDRSVVRAEARFSTGTLANTFTSYLVKNADNWVVSRTGTASALGIYYVAYVLPNILRQRLTWMATDVLTPVFARMVADSARSRRAYRDALSMLAYIGFPAMAGIAVLAPRVVHVFFGPPWAHAAGPLRWLAIAALAEFVTQATTPVFIAHGVPGRSALIKLAALIALLGGLALTYRHGLTAIALAVLTASCVSAAFSQLLINRLLGIGARTLTVALAPVAVITVTMSLALLAIGRAVAAWPPAAALTLLVPSGAAIYLLAGRLLFPSMTRTLLRETVALAIPRQAGDPGRVRHERKAHRD